MILTVHTKPQAKVSRVERVLDASTVICRVAAPAREGKANKELLRLLAAYFDCAPSLLSIKRGTSISLKQIEVPDAYTKRLSLQTRLSSRKVP